MSIIILFLKIFLLSWFLNNFTPAQMLLKSILKYNLRHIFKFPITILLQILECLKCTSFWVGFLLTGNIFIGALMAYLGMWYKNRLSCYEEFIKI